uniref:Cna B domain protein n=1 Tax=Solibacter usitatus (strain Ellin6076) TaxID=234267 RepID=Q020N4_SOLUE
MKTIYSLCALLLCLCLLGSAGLAQSPSGPALRGTITDPSGALVPGAVVQLRGPGGEQRQTTGVDGLYNFTNLKAGKYTVRVIAAGFTVSSKQNFEITGPMVLDAQLVIQSDTQVLNVDDEANKVSADPTANGSALVLGEKELTTLSDDPDELQQQLQAMAGPGAGPNGGQIYIDGFTGGNLPNKSSIREVRINSNPFSPEYERPGFGRIEVFTRPGTDLIHGNLFGQYNKEFLNSRNPLLTSSQRPPYKQNMFGVNLTGPIKKQKASFGLDVMRRSTQDNAFILATTLDSNFQPQSVNQSILTPQSTLGVSPRLDYAINPSNTLVARFQYNRMSFDNQGIGSFNLSSKAYDQRNTEKTLQLTETAVVSPRFINESRFQYMHSDSLSIGNNTVPAITVAGAFSGGGAQVGNSGTGQNNLEFSNTSTWTRKTHTIKWGGRIRQTYLDSTSVNNFGGSYTFLAGSGPALDVNNNPLSGDPVQLSALEVYRRTLIFQNAGMTDAQIRLLGGGASQFSLSAGAPTTSVSQIDAGLFLNDDWRARPNLTFSYGLRYETQNNIGDHKDFSPRIGFAWGLDAKGTQAAKTVLRGGFGIFFDRVSDNVTLNALRFDGVTQQSYFLINPNFYPLIPSLSVLAASKQPQNLQYKDGALQAPRNYQASIGVDRQINKYVRLSTVYLNSRGVHLSRSRDINAPINGLYPYGDSQLRYLTETTGFSRTNQLQISPSVNYKKLFLFGFYSLSYGKTDAEGQAADPYNLRAEWGPSSFADVRHRMVIGTSIPLPFKVSMSPFITASSGAPYNITTGRDTNGDSITTERPSLVTLGSAQCVGRDFYYSSQFGCFNLAPAAGTAISRNYARGPGAFNMSVRLNRSWTIGGKGEASSGMGGMMMGGPGGGGPGGGGMRGPGGGGPPPGGGMMTAPPPGMMGAAGATQTPSRRYTITLGVNASNILNHVNFAAPSGDLGSPFFGQYRSLAGGFVTMGPGGSSTYNRKIDVQLRLGF